MGDEILVDQYVDRPRIASDTDFFADQLKTVMELIDKINNTKISLGKADGMKDVVTGAKSAKDAIDKLKKSKDDLMKADLNAAKAAKALADAEKAEAQARKENAAAALKEQQLSNSDAKQKEKQKTDELGAAYKEYSKAARDASLRAKSYALTLGESHPTTVAAVKDAKEMNDILLKVDKSVGQSGRNVGNYASAYDGLGASFTNISRELPSLTISVQQFVLAISNNLPMLADEIGKAKTEIAGMVAEGKEAPSLFQRIASSALSWNVGLSVGIALLTAYAGEIATVVAGLLDSEAAAKKAAKEQAEYNERLLEAIQLRDKALKTTTLDRGTEERNLENQIAYAEAAGKSQVEVLKLQKQLLTLKAIGAQTLFNAEEPITGKKGEVALDELGKSLNKATIDYNEFLTKRRLSFSLADKIFNGEGTTSLSKDEIEQGQALKAEFDRQTQLFERQKGIVEDYYNANRDLAVNDLELQKAIAAERIKFFADELQYRADQQKDLSTNEEAGLATRLNARRTALNLEKQILKGQKDDEVADAKGNANKLFEIYRKYNFDRMKLEEEYQNDVFHIRQNAIAIQREQEQADNEMFYKDMQDRAAKEIDIAQQQEAKRQLARTQGQQLELHALDAQYQATIAKVKEGSDKRAQVDRDYAKKKADIEYSYAVAEVNSQIQQAEQIIAIRKKYGEDTTADEETLAKLRMRLSDITTQHIIDNGKKEYKDWQERLRATEKGLSTIQDLWKGGTDFISGMIDAQTTKQKNAIQDQINGIDAKSKEEIDAINASAATTQEKANEIQIVEAKAAAQKAELQRKQAQLDERKAKFDKAANIGRIIIETALAVVHQLGSGDPVTALPRAIAAGALGAAQLAVAIASPIPKYKDGREGGPATLAYVGDGGKHEVVTSPDMKRAYVTPNTDTLTYLQKDWKVFPDVEAFQAAAGGSMPIMQMSQMPNGNDRMVHAMAREIGSLKEAIKNMPGTTWVMTHGEWVKYEKRGRETIKYLQSNF